MVTRIWHGYTTPENADTYEAVLRNEGFPSIVAKKISGFRGIQLLRNNLPEETEFVTIMWFDSIEQVKYYAGENYQKAAVLDKVRKVLSRFDEYVKHYEMRVESRAIE
ncbi:MAG: Dabb family protein [Bacteroidetes bacterium]|nr:Dabb family protein [Bacteroidota bacterium]